MKLIFKCILYSLSLVLTETMICIILFAITLPFSQYLKKIYELRLESIGASLRLNAIRLLFYYPIYITVFIYLMKHLNVENRVVQIAFINCGLYIFISLLYGFIFMPGTKEFFGADFFYFLIIATFSSPFILNRIPYCKKLVKEL